MGTSYFPTWTCENASSDAMSADPLRTASHILQTKINKGIYIEVVDYTNRNREANASSKIKKKGA
jgi:hypothetical protein